MTDVKSLIAHAKANPGKLSFAIGSAASAGHLATEQLRRAAGMELFIVPQKARHRRIRICSAAVSPASLTRSSARQGYAGRVSCA